MIHTEPSPFAGKTVTVKLVKAFHNHPDETSFEVVVEDYWDRLSDTPWGISDGNPAAMFYGLRAGMGGLPWDDEVVYTKDTKTGLGNIVHVSEIEV